MGLGLALGLRLGLEHGRGARRRARPRPTQRTWLGLGLGLGLGFGSGFGVRVRVRVRVLGLGFGFGLGLRLGLGLGSAHAAYTWKRLWLGSYVYFSSSHLRHVPGSHIRMVGSRRHPWLGLGLGIGSGSGLGCGCGLGFRVRVRVAWPCPHRPRGNTGPGADTARHRPLDFGPACMVVVPKVDFREPTWGRFPAVDYAQVAVPGRANGRLAVWYGANESRSFSVRTKREAHAVHRQGRAVLCQEPSLGRLWRDGARVPRQRKRQRRPFKRAACSAAEARI